MSMCLFVGPTLPRTEVAALCDATLLPPAAQGDVFRAAQARPQAIGIIDGYFSGAPSVWHKEILWALAQGIHVFGSSSMGALRAAELHPFGMRGVGRIFEDYRAGQLEDDDEVAVEHGPAELGYPALSEPMVNIRATLEQAEAEGIVTPPVRRRLETFAKALHFPQRSWPVLLDADKMHGVGRARLAALADWLPQGRVDQKREDALAMIRAMQETVAAPEPPEAPFRFARTHFWDEMTARSGAVTDMESSPVSTVLEELRLEGLKRYEHVQTRALARLLADAAAARAGTTVSRDDRLWKLSELRAERGLYTRAELDAWMDENGFDAPALERLVEAEARLEAVTTAAGTALDAALIDELRLGGAYPRLARRAAAKRRALAGDPVQRPKIDPMWLRAWYFERRLGQSIPEDLAEFARKLGFGTLAEFDIALRREILFVESDREPDG